MARTNPSPAASASAPRESGATWRTRLRASVPTFLFSFVLPFLAAADTPGTQPDPAAARIKALDEFRAISTAVRDRLQHGQLSKQDFVGHYRTLEELRMRLNDPGSVEDTQILVLQASILVVAFEECDAAEKIAGTIKTTAGESAAAKAGIESIEMVVARCKAAKQARSSLIGAPAPALKFLWSSRKGLTSLGDLKGRVVVLDFWVNTDSRSVAMFPTLRRLEERFRGLDVEVVGVTAPVGVIFGLKSEPMDFRGKPEREMRALLSYMKAKKITWTVAATATMEHFGAYGCTRHPYMAIIAPDGTVREIITDSDVAYLTRAEAIDRLLKEFGKPTSGLLP